MALASYSKLLVVVVVSGSTACGIVEFTSILVTVGTSVGGVVEANKEEAVTQVADDTDVPREVKAELDSTVGVCRLVVEAPNICKRDHTL